MPQAIRVIDSHAELANLDVGHPHPQYLRSGDALLDGGGAVFNVRAPQFGAVGTGLVDDGPAARAAYAALVANGGGTLVFPGGGTYLLDTTGTPAGISLARDNTRTRGLTRIVVAPGATIKLSANTPRFLDFAKQADHDVFRALDVGGGGTIDANNVGGKHHVIVGTYQNGVQTERINLEDLAVHDLRCINAPNDPASTSQRIHVWLVVAHPAANEATQNTVRRIAITDLDLAGGNGGVGVLAVANVSAPANVYLDDILVARIRHDTGATPAISAPYASSNIHVGSEGTIGRAVIRDCHVARAGDTGIEVNGGRDVLVAGCTVEDSAGPAFYVSNYASVADTAYTFRSCEARWTGAWEQDGVSGLNHQGFASAGNALGAVTLEDCTYRSSGGSYARNATGANSGLGLALNAPTQRVTLDGVRAEVGTYTADNAAFANPNLVRVRSASGAMHLTIRNLRLRWTGTHPGAGTWTPRYLQLGAADGTLDLDGLTYYEDWGGSVGSNNLFALLIGLYASDVWRGRIRGVRIERLADDSNPVGIRLLDGAGATIDGRLLIAECDFAGMTAGTEVQVIQAAEAHKVVYRDNRWRSTTNRGATLHTGSGAPDPSRGLDGDYYLRVDTPTVANQRVYVKAAGAWTGLL